MAVVGVALGLLIGLQASSARGFVVSPGSEPDPTGPLIFHLVERHALRPDVPDAGDLSGRTFLPFFMDAPSATGLGAAAGGGDLAPLRVAPHHEERGLVGIVLPLEEALGELSGLAPCAALARPPAQNRAASPRNPAESMIAVEDEPRQAESSGLASPVMFLADDCRPVLSAMLTSQEPAETGRPPEGLARFGVGGLVLAAAGIATVAWRRRRLRQRQSRFPS